MNQINGAVIYAIRRLDGYKFLPACMIGMADGARPNRD
jgi:hypothetical protein